MTRVEQRRDDGQSNADGTEEVEIGQARERRKGEDINLPVRGLLGVIRCCQGGQGVPGEEDTDREHGQIVRKSLDEGIESGWVDLALEVGVV